MKSYRPIGQRSRSLRSCSQALPIHAKTRARMGARKRLLADRPVGMTTRTWRIFEEKNKEHGGSRGCSLIQITDLPARIDAILTSITLLPDQQHSYTLLEHSLLRFF